jgi:nucleotide-binding universal stress UspA family protein
LKGLEKPEQLFQIAVKGMREEFPPPRTAAAAFEVGTPAATPLRSILVSARDAEQLDALLELAARIARRSSRELILIHPLGGEELLTEAAAALDRRRQDLLSQGLAARAAAFTSVSPADDLLRAVAEQEVDLLLTDAPEALLDDDVLLEVLARAASDVGVLVRGRLVPRDGAILVPFAGTEHDWAAVELAAQIAGEEGTLRLAGLSGEQSETGRDASRLLASASLALQRALGSSVEPLLLPPDPEALVQEADGAALVVVGLPEQWKREGLGTVRRALAREARPPVLLARRGLRPGVLAPPESLTRFTWTIRAS